MDANLILLPTHPDYGYPKISGGSAKHNPQTEHALSPYNEDSEQLTRGKLRDYMIAHQIKGTKPMPQRSPFIGDTKTFTSPIDKDTKFVIRRLSVVQVMTYRDRNSVVRFITEEESGRYTQEKDYPTGTMNVDLAVLGLASWNIQDLASNDVKINEDTIKTYLDPEELDFIAEKVLEVNPILSNRGNQKSQTDQSSPTTTGSDSGGSEPPSVSQLLQSAANGTAGVSGDTLPSPLSAHLDTVPTPS
jgi:hypothetical protein